MSAKEITSILKINPTKSYEKGTPLSPSFPKRNISPVSFWSFDSPTNGEETLHTHIEHLISLIENNLDKFKKITEVCKIEIYSSFFSKERSGGFFLDSSILKRLTIIPIDIIVILYPPGDNIALGELGRYEEEIKSYDKALEINPDEHLAWYNRGIALEELGRYEEAIKSHDKALEINPDDDNSWNSRGLALAKLRRYEEAIKCYDKALEINPDDDYAWYNKACAYALQNNIDLALENLKKAISLNPECRKIAKNDEDFDSIRDNQCFQELIGN